jgi:integrase
LAYTREVVPTRKTADTMRYKIKSLASWWGDKLISDVNGNNCRAYTKTLSQSAAGSNLKLLQAAIHHWHREHGPLTAVPKVSRPPEPPRRERWLTVNEAARLLKAARRNEYLRRFILLGLHTGSRPGVIFNLTWDQIDLASGLMKRRAEGLAESKNKKAPTVKLGRKILSHLRRWHRLDAGRCKLVVHYNGKAMYDPHGSWKRAVKAAKLPGKVTRHTLRHTRATWLMQRGADMWSAAGFLGMTTATLERVYGHHHPDFQGDVADL